jgi:import inner membrane translocase subunit TIM44
MPRKPNLQRFAVAALNEMKAAILPQQSATSALRGVEKATINPTDTPTTTTDLVATKAPPPTAFASWLRDMGDKLSSHPFSKRIRNATAPVGDIAEDLKLRWETSDSSLVHRIDDMMAETDTAKALREVRTRDPNFDMVDFLQKLKTDVPSIISSYLAGRQEEITSHCTPDFAERVTGILKTQAASGLVPDPTLLDNSDVELVDVKWADDAPIIVVQFTCQQINCTRDLHSNVVEGGPDEVQRVYYYWALAQDEAGYQGIDGNWHPPRWLIKDMMVRGMHHLL